MKKAISERIKEALSIRNMKQSELVEKTQIGKSSISTYISGAYEPKQRNIYKIAEALDVNEAWLMGHDVPMDRISTVNKLDITKEELTLLNNYNKLNDLGKREANKRVSELTEISKYTLDTKTYEEPITMAAHDDNLTDDEKNEMNRRIEEFEKNLNK